MRLALIVIIPFLLLSVAAFAQAPPPSTNPPGAPLDVIVSVLIAGGIGYGTYRIKKNSDH